MTNYEIAYCALVEAAAKLLKTVGIDIVNNPLLASLAEAQLKKYDPQIQSLLGSVLSDPPMSIDLGADMLSEKAGSVIKGFGEELKQKMKMNAPSKGKKEKENSNAGN